MKTLTSIRIGKKIGVIIGVAMLQLVCLGVLALWTVHALNIGYGAAKLDAREEALALSISSDVNALGVNLAGAMLAGRLDQDSLNRILALRKEYLGYFDELKSLSTTTEGEEQRGRLEAIVQHWRDANITVIDALQAGKPMVAKALYDARVRRRAEELRAQLAEYLAFRQARSAAISEQLEAIASRTRTILITFTSIWLAISIFLGITISRSIAVPLTVAINQLGHMAQGDLSLDVTDESQARGDEIGMLARATQKMIVNLRAMIGEISAGIQMLASSSTELSSSSAQMTTGSRGASDKAHSVAAAAEEMSSNVTSVASGMEQTTTNLASVASATEQMTATIGEIAGNSEKARRITGEATRQSARITEQIKQLGQAAHEIGKVTETITEISSQTNLLALNATIEAARAGSAGKGFAVVAGEIKALAQQTAAATEDIKNRIAGVQSATSGGIAEIDKVSHVIQEVSDIVASIAAAIEEQATTTKDIARNVTEASQGVADANTRVAETANVSKTIAKDIQFVDHVAGDMANGSDQVRTSATELAGLAENLRVTAARFHA
jgi:methyl-accepting chemotaxis protein